MIKNMKIKKSLILGFGVTIVVSVLIIIASIILMTMQKSQYTSILDSYVGANGIVSDCRINYNIAGRSLRDAVLGGNMTYLDDALSKISDLKEDLSKLESVYPLKDRTELNAFVDTVEAWEVEAEKIVSVARGNTEESRTQAAALIASDCSPRLQ